MKNLTEEKSKIRLMVLKLGGLNDLEIKCNNCGRKVHFTRVLKEKCPFVFLGGYKDGTSKTELNHFAFYDVSRNILTDCFPCFEDDIGWGPKYLEQRWREFLYNKGLE